MTFRNVHNRTISSFFKNYCDPDKIRLFGLSLIFFGAVGCGASSDEDPGLCKLSCSKAKIGDSVGMKVTSLGSTEGIEATCTTSAASSPFPRPLVLRFSVTTEVDGALYGKEAGKMVNLPASGIALNVITSGSIFYAEGSSPKNGVLGTNGFEPPEYTGVATPIDEWCTDSCGVLTIQVWPQCPGVGEKLGGSVVVSSGSLMQSLAISVSTEKPSALAPSLNSQNGQKFEDLLNSSSAQLYHGIRISEARGR